MLEICLGYTKQGKKIVQSLTRSEGPKTKYLDIPGLVVLRRTKYTGKILSNFFKDFI